MEGHQESAEEYLTETVTSGELSCVSMKSNNSMWTPIGFSNGTMISDSRKEIPPSNIKHSHVSLRSNNSMWTPLGLCDGTMTTDPSVKRDDLIQVHSRCGVCMQVLKDLVSVSCGHTVCNSLYCQSGHSGDFDCAYFKKTSGPRSVLNLREVKAGSGSAGIDLVKERYKEEHKTSMKRKYESIFEVIKLKENQILLSQVYTQLYLIEGESKGVNEEHEVLQMEKTYKTFQYTPINCNDIFYPLIEPGYEGKAKKKKKILKTVLTKGIAGIGKTVSVQKFILDWAEGKANQDIDFMFVLSFRELNLIKDDQCSLHQLLLDLHPELKDLDSQIYEDCKVVFIFDGLDENRIKMMLPSSKKVSDVTETSSVGSLLSNLIKGELLPSALIWITSRPAAASQIPSEYINRVTEIQGFGDSQKEEYFRKRIRDEHQASRIISHIIKSRSLYIMCHIPVFCWISATVLQNILKQDHSAEIPKTLTEMYTHFLLIHINMRNQKYDEVDLEKPQQSNREVIVKLAKLAFKQLMKGNVIFYKEDLRECGINVTEVSVFSGVCTEVFKEESVNHQRKIYSFVHLSFQEFLAAFYVFYCYLIRTEEAFDSLHNLHKRVMDEALDSENGHLDLFLRFLLGISLESNQRLLQDLLTNTEKSAEGIKKTTTYIKDKIINEKCLRADRSINLFLCLLELNNQTLCREIQEFLMSEKHSEKELSPSHCSAMAFMLQMSEEVLDGLDLKKFNTSWEGRRRLLPAVINYRRALLNNCKLTDQCCESLASALQSPVSALIELDVSNNDLQDSGVKLLSAALKNPNCKLEILRLSGCMVTKEGCCYLASALKSNPSHLTVLDLSYNHPGDSGVKLLSDLLKDPYCKLEKLNVDHGGPARIRQTLRKYACDLTLDLNTTHSHLIQSDENKKVTHVYVTQSYPDHPDRFEHFEQVLSKESLTGRHYWEAEWSGKLVHVSMTYKGISRKGERQCSFGKNDKSWSLFCTGKILTAWHNNTPTEVRAPEAHSNIIGVYLDWPAGTLSFYNVSDTHALRHLHTYYSTFTEPLYAGLSIFESEASLRQL